MRQSLSNLAAVLAIAGLGVTQHAMNVGAPLEVTPPSTGGFSYLQPKHFRTGQAKARRAATKARNQARHRHHCKRAQSARKGRA